MKKIVLSIGLIAAALPFTVSAQPASSVAVLSNAAPAPAPSDGHGDMKKK